MRLTNIWQLCNRNMDFVTTTTSSSESDDDVNDQLEKTKQILRDIWFVMMRNNIVSIVIVGLLVLVVILVIALLVWAYLFLDSYERNHQEGRSLFYRRLSGAKKPIMNDRKEIYGATNRAFESGEGGPQSDVTASGATAATGSESAASSKEVSTVAGRSTFFGWINSQGQISEEDKTTSQESVQTELAEEIRTNGTS